MNKQLKSEDENSKKIPFSLKEIQELTLFCSTEKFQLICFSSSSNKPIVSSQTSTYPCPLFSIFQPPQIG